LDCSQPLVKVRIHSGVHE